VSGVDVHEADVAYVREGRNAPAAQTTAGRLMTRLPGGTFDAVTVATELTDGQVIDVAGGVRVVHTPGHTPGHVSLLHEQSGVLITGDAIFNMSWGMSWPMSFVCTSMAQNKQSAHVLGELEYDVAAFTHGPEVRDNAREAVRGFLRRKG
jgi:glyoxylase-like metal-dependent hydrolase (beta-lactamase superfamily II)